MRGVAAHRRAYPAAARLRSLDGGVTALRGSVAPVLASRPVRPPGTDPRGSVDQSAAAARAAAVAQFLLVLGLLYLFLVGVGVLEEGIAALGSGFEEGLLESVDHPLAGVFAGTLATVLVQSSSVTTSTIVGLVGAGTLGVGAAVPMIMGANIGTTVTNTVASLGSVRRTEEFRRAFAGATVHDLFNVLAVVTLLPLELATGFLSSSADELAQLLGSTGIEGTQTSSPIKQAVEAPAGWVESAASAAVGGGTGLGLLLLALGIGLIFLALTYITRNMRQLIAGRLERTMNRFIASGGGAVGMAVGLVVTVLVQSSSITTSIMVPMMGAGVLTLINAYPITLGANLGTTVTALVASLAVDLPAGLVVALTHTLFNVTGILLFYPVPALRRIPPRLADRLADQAVRSPTSVIGYVIGLFVVVPALGIAVLR